MADNTGKTKGSIISAIQSAQTAVGSALKGGQMAMAGGDGGASQSIPLLEDLRQIGRENEKNTESMLNVFKDMFAWDKEKFARMRDQSREKRGEKLDAKIASNQEGGSGLPDFTGGFSAAALAGITSLVYFAKELGANTDILKLPQQLKSIKAMAGFAKGIGTIGTLGFGPQIIDGVADAVKTFGSGVTEKFKLNIATPILDKFKTWKADFVKKTPFAGITTTFDEAIKSVKLFFDKPIFKTMKGSLDEAAKTIKATMGSVIAVFKGGGGGPAGSGGTPGLFADDGPLKNLIKPLKAIGRLVGKLFLPLTVILGIFDGYTGYMEEYEKDQSVLDGIKGAVKGIVDGFIGSFVRLATGAIAAGLEFLGLDALATTIDEFGVDITEKFSTAVGGLVDFVTGIFSLDLERITKGLKNLVGGTADFLFTLVTTPVDVAIGFVQDIFNLGDPDNPFTIRGFLFGDEATGEKGVINKAVDFVKDLFNMDGLKEKFDNIKASVLNFGLRAKAVVAASAAFVKAGFPGGESPTEAYKRVFDEVMASGQANANDKTESGEDIAKTSVTNVEGDTTETTYKTETINRYGKKGESNVVYIDNSSNQNSQTTNQKNETYTGSLTTGSDSYFDREAYGGA